MIYGGLFSNQHNMFTKQYNLFRPKGSLGYGFISVIALAMHHRLFGILTLELKVYRTMIRALPLLSTAVISIVISLLLFLLLFGVKLYLSCV